MHKAEHSGSKTVNRTRKRRKRRRCKGEWDYKAGRREREMMMEWKKILGLNRFKKHLQTCPQPITTSWMGGLHVLSVTAGVIPGVPREAERDDSDDRDDFWALLLPVLLMDEDCWGFSDRLRGASVSGVELAKEGMLSAIVPLLLCAGNLINSTLSLSCSCDPETGLSR
jgi:hypothetical protein